MCTRELQLLVAAVPPNVGSKSPEGVARAWQKLGLFSMEFCISLSRHHDKTCSHDGFFFVTGSLLLLGALLLDGGI